MKIKKYPVFVGLLFLGAVTLLAGCSTIILFDPKGPVGESERFVIITAAVLMAIVVVPVFIMAFWIPRKYRASNTEATYMPKWSHSVKIELFMWGLPLSLSRFWRFWPGPGPMPWTPISPSLRPPTSHHRSRLPGLEMALHLPGSKYRHRQSNHFPRQGAAQLQNHLGYRHGFVLHPAIGQPDLRHGRHAYPLAPPG